MQITGDTLMREKVSHSRHRIKEYCILYRKIVHLMKRSLCLGLWEEVVVLLGSHACLLNGF